MSIVHVHLLCEMFLTNILCAIIFLIILRIYLHFKSRYRYWQDRGVKVIEPIWVPLGNLWSLFIKDKGAGHMITEWYKVVDSEVIGLYAINEPILLIKDPDLIRDILVKDFNCFTDRGVFMDKNDSLTGQLWKLPGFKWKPLRAKMSTCFTVGKLKMMFPTLLKAGIDMELYLENVADKDPIDVEDLCRRFTADIVAHSIFGVEVNSFRDEENDFLKMIQCIFMNSSRKNMIKAALQGIAPKFLESINFIKFETVNQVALNFVHKMVEKIIEFRKETGTVGNDMMELLIQLKEYGEVEDDTREKQKPGKGVCLTMDEVVAQAYTYFFTGSETASSTLILLFYECSMNEEIQNKLQKDIDSALASTEGKVTYEAILNMKYLNMVISETLRKYPILQFLPRKSVVNYKLEKLDLELKKGTQVYISVEGLHRDPKYYPEPEKFDPGRFSREKVSERHPLTYIPFGEGPRNCIGKRLGYFMVAVGVIHLFKKFNLKACNALEVPLKMNPYTISLKPKNPIMLKISQRSGC